MGSYYAIERRDLKDFNRYYDQSDIAIRDIDTTEVSFWVREDVMYVMLPTRDTLQATWGKFDSKLNRWKFKVPANEVILAYLTSNEKINSNFESHIMFSPAKEKPIDFTLVDNSDLDTLKMFNEVKSVIRQYWKN